MNIHEYQSKQILRDFGITTPAGIPVTDVDSAVKAAAELGTDVVVVKSQIHAGGRGKAGGIQLAHSLDEVKAHATDLLGKVLITPQTGPEGKEVKKLLIEEGLHIRKEFYLSIILDRQTSRLIMMGSEEGGTSIEEVAAATPEKIIKEEIDPVLGLMPYQARRLAFGMNIPAPLVNKAAKFMMKMYNVYISKDATTVEINPLVLTEEEEFVALDAKFNFDENALYRQKDVVALRDMEEEDPKEIEAGKHGLSYIALDGNIGCMINGAGLAMATMDTISYYGGQPANFLDVGGSATADKVTEAFKIILSDDNVKGIFVNIFGGIMQCDVIAEGIIKATREIDIQVPLVVRLEGTNVERGKRLLKESGLAIVPATTMADGAQQIIELVSKEVELVK